MDTESHCISIKQTKLIVNSSFIVQEDRRPRSWRGSPSLTLGYRPKPTTSNRFNVSCFQTPRIKKPSPQQPSHLETESVRTWEIFSNLRFLEGLPDMAHTTTRDSLPARLPGVAPVPTPRTYSSFKARSQQNLEPQSTSDLHRPQRRGSAPMQVPP